MELKGCYAYRKDEEKYDIAGRKDGGDQPRLKSH